MPIRKAFGRRATPQRQTVIPSFAASPLAPAAASSHVPVNLSPPPAEQIVDVDREVEEWNAMRKAKKRSFREPWRSLAIAATIGFGLSSWLLPDSVGDVAQLVTVALCGASIIAGWRRPTLPTDISD